MFIFCLDNSIYEFVKCLSCFEKNECTCDREDYYKYLSNMSVEELNKEYDLLVSFKYEFKHLSNLIVANLFNSIKEFDEHNLKESFTKLYKEIETYFFKILDIINGKEKINIIEGEINETLTQDDVFAFATTVIGAGDDPDYSCFGIFDDLVNLLHYFANFISDLVFVLFFKKDFDVQFEVERIDNDNYNKMLIGRYSDIYYYNKEVRRDLIDDNENLIGENIKYELQRGFHSLMDDYGEGNRFQTTAINQLNINKPKFHFWQRKLSPRIFKFLSDRINRNVFKMDEDWSVDKNLD